MLTKEERKEIANTARSLEGCTLYYKEIYKCLFGKYPQGDMTSEEEDKEILIRILDLCDTSNMIELPLDKDGEVIQVGDTVYIGDSIKYEVAGYMMRGNGTEVILAAGAEPVYIKEPANNITHKQPVTAKSLAQRIRDVLRNDHSEMSPYTSRELVHIANDLERLGDNNE